MKWVISEEGVLAKVNAGNTPGKVALSLLELTNNFSLEKIDFDLCLQMP